MTELPDPVCLDFPEQDICPGNLPTWPRLPEHDSTRQRVSLLPPVGLAACLHASLIVVAMTLGLGSGNLNTDLQLTLLPAVTLPGNALPPALTASAATPVAPSAPAPSIPDRIQSLPSQPPVRATSKPRPQSPKPIVPRAEAVQAPSVIQPASPKPSAHIDQPVSSAQMAHNPTADVAEGGAGSGATSAVGSAATISAGARSGEAGVGSSGGSGETFKTTFGNADGPHFVERVAPKYPELARRKGREGVVVLRLSIAADGRLRDVQVVEGGGFGFEEAALAAVRSSTYTPATRNGRAVECSALLPIRFALQGS